AGSPPLEGSGVVGKTQPPTTNSGYESKASRAGSPPLEGSGVVDKAPPLSDGSESGSKSSSVDSPPLEGSGVVSYKSQGKIYINPTQFFNNISSSVWTLQMGKYAPAQEWLRSKEGKQLTSNDIRHYQRIIAAIAETQRLSKKIINITNE
ncbi:MAG: hypothetical protein J5I50_03220, partial [Chitinophagaceae bacterium]|nr:hypothetical protein [Chitinophagaceae bacterium]